MFTMLTMKHDCLKKGAKSQIKCKGCFVSVFLKAALGEKEKELSLSVLFPILPLKLEDPN